MKSDFSQIDNMLNRLEKALMALPVQVGAEAVMFFDEGFDKQGWQGDGGLEPWKYRRDNLDPDRAILTGKAGGHLRNGIHFRAIGHSILIGVNGPAAEYADIHNSGGTTHPRLTAKMRAWAWAMYKSTGRIKYKALAITNKTTTDSPLTIHIPQRRFIGNSIPLRTRLEKLIAHQLQEAIKRK
ncbi:MAG TPA: hypothetical protein PK323_12885 [Bacteroidia bacterium]|nr:hypothetical protein [Bacteroidia bacterium]